jgi:hypothetical protein
MTSRNNNKAGSGKARAEGAHHTHRPVAKTLWPGQDGTIKLARRYGHALVCVRYRHDAEGRMRYTTVELIVDEAPIQRRLSERKMVGVRIAWGEEHLSARAKALGAKWDRNARLWRMSLKVARALGFTDRIQHF